MNINELPLPVQITLLVEQVAYVYKISPHELIGKYSLNALITLSELANYRKSLDELSLETEEVAVRRNEHSLCGIG